MTADTASQLARIADALEIVASALTGIGMTLDDLDNRDSVRGSS